MTYFFAFSIPFIIVFLITPTIRHFALKFYIIDKKNHRKIHKKIVTKMGGLAIYLGFLSGIAVLTFLDTVFLRAHLLSLGGLILSGTLMLMVGMYDDFHSSNPYVKLFIQVIIAFLLVRIGFKLTRIFVPGVIDLSLGRYAVPLTILWLVGISNAINLIDGLDGLAAGAVAIISLFLALYGFLFRENFLVYVSLALLGANLSFLKYNFYPAKIFMGDTGSLFLGFIIGGLAVYVPRSQSANNIFFIPAFILLFFPILDTGLAIIRRTAVRRHLFKGDFSHIHHYLIKRGFNQTRAVKLLYFLTFCLGILSLLVLYNFRSWMN